MKPIIESLPGLRTVALLIARDNGLINRTCTEAEWLGGLDVVLGAEGVYFADLLKVDAWCSSLSPEDRETLAAGEEEDMMALYVRFPHDAKLLGIFEDIFSPQERW